MHENHAAGRGCQRNGLPVTCDVFRHHSRESAVAGVAIEIPVVATRDDLETAVLFTRVVKIDQRGDKVCVRMRKLSQVLVPLDSRADARALHVQLAVMKLNRGADERLNAIQDSAIVCQPAKRLMLTERA